MNRTETFIEMCEATINMAKLVKKFAVDYGLQDNPIYIDYQDQLNNLSVVYEEN